MTTIGIFLFDKGRFWGLLAKSLSVESHPRPNGCIDRCEFSLPETAVKEPRSLAYPLQVEQSIRHFTSYLLKS